MSSVIIGSDNNDSISGTAIEDIITAGLGNDIVSGGSGNDVIYGNEGDDTLYGGAGDDILIGGSGSNTLDGGAGIDTVSYEDYSATVGIIAHLDNGYVYTAYSVSSLDTILNIENIIATNLRDILYGSNLANRIDGNDGDDSIYGLDGNDYLLGGKGNNYIDGGNGIDTISYEGQESFGNVGVVVQLIEQYGTHSDINSNFQDTLINIENVIGTNAADYIYGNMYDNRLEGRGYNDYLFGLEGNDYLIGGSGNDRIDGGLGNDTVSYEDIVAESNTPFGITIDLNAGQAVSNNSLVGFDTLTSIESVIGSIGNDIIIGSASANVLMGGDGNDTLRGLGGNDILNGGNGNDTVSYQDAGFLGVVVNLSQSSANSTDANVGVDTLVNIENVIGSLFNDTITGNNDNNRLLGLDGDDKFIWSLGNDIYDGGAGIDSIYYSNTLSSSMNLDFRNTISIERVIGTSSNDIISWIQSPTTLNLAGNGGNDKFSFNLNNAPGVQKAVINDFTPSLMPMSALNKDFLEFDIAAGASASVSSSLITYNGVGSTLLKVIVSGNVLAEITLQGTTFPVTSNDYAFI